LKIWNCLLQKKTCDVSISWAFSVLLIQNALCFFISVSILPVQNSTIVAETSESVQARSVKPFFYWEKSCVEILWCVRISVQGIRFRYQKKKSIQHSETFATRIVCSVIVHLSLEGATYLAASHGLLGFPNRAKASCCQRFGWASKSMHRFRASGSHS
jgi:hypothetical protein